MVVRTGLWRCLGKAGPLWLCSCVTGAGGAGEIMEQEDMPLTRRLRQEILFARERVQRFGPTTPL